LLGYLSNTELLVDDRKDVHIEPSGFVMQSEANACVIPVFVHVGSDERVIANVQIPFALEYRDGLEVAGVVVSAARLQSLIPSVGKEQASGVDPRVGCVASLDGFAGKNRLFMPSEHGARIS
jgi:hypothetical protein